MDKIQLLIAAMNERVEQSRKELEEERTLLDSMTPNDVCQGDRIKATQGQRTSVAKIGYFPDKIGGFPKE